MRSVKPIGLAASLLVMGANAPAQEAAPFDVPPDQPRAVATGSLLAPIRLVAADGVIDTGASWGHASPWIADVDGDGLQDLIVGDFSGLFRFHRNQGTNAKPSYAAAVNLKAGGVDAKVPIY